jgi:transcriptional regulator with XRE-family HTH domain
MVHPIIFGKALTQCRKWFNLSQNDIAQLLGVTNQAVSKWELGNSTPNITLLWMLSEIFFIDVKTLLTFNENSKNILYANKSPSNYFVRRNKQLMSPISNMSKSFFFNCSGDNLKFNIVKLYQCIFSNSKLLNITINNCNFDCVNFTNCKFSKISVNNTKFSYMRFLLNLESCEYELCNFNNCIYLSETFKDCGINNSIASECSYSKTVFSNVSINKCQINNCIFCNTSFYYCVFIDTKFTNNIFNKCSLIDCTFDKKTYQLLQKINITIVRPKIK